MGPMDATARRLTLLVGTAALAVATFAASAAPAARIAGPSGAVSVRFERLRGFASPGTPTKYNRVGVLETGSSSAKNILILVPGTSASAAFFEPLAKDIVRKTPGWQVWAVERRENLLEDHSMLDRAKQRKASPKQLFDYYLGFLSDKTITNHFQLIPDAQVAFARQWGMQVAVEDLRRVVKAAKQRDGRVVMGGHSLGGSITTAYATWDFNGQAGAKDLSGLVFIDGGSGPTPVSPQQATQSLQALQNGTPWLTFGGITAPYAGLFNAVASTSVHNDPNGVSPLGSWPLLPANLKPPVAANNEGGYGYALDTKTSPMGLIAAQAHLGSLAPTGTPRGWDGTGGLTPIQRFADMFSGTGLAGLDGTAWYHPQRLTLDSGAVADGNANPTQAILDVKATHGNDLPTALRIYAFGAALGGQRVLDTATILSQQSRIPAGQVTLLNRQATYAHNDPAGASPTNDFLSGLVPFLNQLGR